MPFALPKNKVIITVAQTGAITNKSLNPNVPEQPDEIAASALACYNEGAAIVHIHARDAQGGNSSQVDVYQSIHDKIRAICPLVIQDSTGGGPELTQEERINCLKAGPEMASLNMGTLMRISGKYIGIPWSNMSRA
jgi:3-keto-5-aminohexanoate cleavage enzyme